jgi:uncharacterized membrane protein YqjE
MNDAQTTTNQPGMATLVQGIVNDIGTLIKQEVRFARKELESDLNKVRNGAVILAIGVAAGLVGFVLLSLMFVFLLHWGNLPADHVNADPSRLPLWACFAIMSAVFLVAGTAFGIAGASRLARVNPLPDQTVQSVQENVSWIANKTASSK